MSFNETMRQELAVKSSQDLLRRIKSLEDKVDQMMGMLTAMQGKPVKAVKQKKSEAA